MMVHLSRLLLLSTVLLGAGTASAQPDRAEAQRAEFEKGWEALEAKNYEEAYRILSALFVEKPSYDVALNLGAAEYQLGKYADAATHLAYGVRNAPPGEDPDTIERGKRGLERVKQRHVATLTIAVDQAGAEVHLDGKAIGVAPIETEVFASPGKHSLEAKLAGFQPTTREVEVEVGQTLAVSLELGAPLAPAAPSPELAPPPRAQHSGVSPRTIALISGAVVTVAAGTTALVFGVKSTSADSRAEEIANSLDQPCLSPGQSATCSELQNELDERNNASQVANIALVVTGVAALATGVTLLAWPADERAAKGLRFQPVAGLTRAGLVLDGRF
jgi:hypothetical protein